MEKITCKHCGTKYAAEVANCPVCGAGSAASDELSFLGEGFEATDAASEIPAEMPELKANAMEDTGAYRWEDILAEINGAVASEDAPSKPAEEPESAPAKEEKKAPAAAPIWQQNSLDDDDDDDDDEEEEAPRPVRHVRERKKKKSSVGPMIAVVLVLALMIAAFFAAKQFGLFDKKEAEEAETPELPVVQEDVLCTGVTLSATELLLTEEGASQILTVTVQPADCTEKVNWISTEPSVAAVDSEGRVTALAEGEANILVSCGSYAATCEVIVDYTPEEATGEESGEETGEESGAETGAEEAEGEMELSATDITMTYPGELARLYVYNSGEQEITWTTDNDTILSIDETGLITAKATGTTNVYAEVDGQTFTCIVRCRLGGEEGQPITVSLNATDISMFYEGETFKFEVAYENGEPEGVTHEWATSDESVCTVDQDGIVTAVGNGTAFISTVADGVNLKCIVRVSIQTAE